jgi:hypothetical protein
MKCKKPVDARSYSHDMLEALRTARSIVSGKNFADFLIMASFSIEGASSKSGRFTIENIGRVLAF